MAKNNDAYALNFFGKFLESYGAAKERDRDYKSKLAENEIKSKRDQEDRIEKERQRAFDEEMRLGDADRQIARLGQESVYKDAEGREFTAAPVDPAVADLAKQRLRETATRHGRGAFFGGGPAPTPSTPFPIPQPGVNLVPYSPLMEQPLPPLPNEAPPPIPGPNLPSKISKAPTFNDGSVQQGAEERRALMGLSDDYNRDAQPFANTVDAFQEAREAFKRAKLAVTTGQSSSVADKALLFAMVRAQNGSRPTDKDVELAIKQGDLGEQAANWYGLAVRGQMTDKMRSDIFKLTRDAMVSKEKEFKTNVEDEYTRKAKYLAPSADPSLVVTKKRPVDWDQLKSEYDAEYSQSQQTGQPASWTQDQESVYQQKKRELELLKRNKGKK